jgi:hypothetical protein
MTDAARREMPASDSAGPLRVRLPGFVADKDIGLGDLVTRMTRAAGITPCGACQERARKMNRWVAFTR